MSEDHYNTGFGYQDYPPTGPSSPDQLQRTGPFAWNDGSNPNDTVTGQPGHTQPYDSSTQGSNQPPYNPSAQVQSQITYQTPAVTYDNVGVAPEQVVGFNSSQGSYNPYTTYHGPQHDPSYSPHISGYGQSQPPAGWTAQQSATYSQPPGGFQQQTYPGAQGQFPLPHLPPPYQPYAPPSSPNQPYPFGPTQQGQAPVPYGPTSSFGTPGSSAQGSTNFGPAGTNQSYYNGKTQGVLSTMATVGANMVSGSVSNKINRPRDVDEDTTDRPA
ncbi:uncharacterized protein IL334_002122 [Kwoniella shivajii]|uniref:Uncharacterized protein n=1 Tax=Kwoniella shivajii TaxID=564305 RepID=A0ABZ1CVH3_9TREE|nr:hypothetical protein IL334_002122 [Kwoniella shivajii]